MSDPVPPPELPAPDPPAPPAPALPAADLGIRWDVAAPVVLAVGTALVVFVFYQIVTALLLQALPGHLRAVLALAQAAGLAGPALLAIGFSRRSGYLPAPPAPARVAPGLGLAVATWTSGLATLAMVVTSSALALLAPELLSRLLSFGAEMYGPLLEVHSPWDVASVILVASIVPAACEELLFRGFLQRLLRTAVSARVAIGCTSVVFALVHVEPIGFLSRLILAIGLGLALERTGSLLLPMAMHAFHNFVVLAMFPWDMSEAATVPLLHEALAGLLAGLPGMAVVGLLWWRSLRALPKGPPE